MAKAAVLAVLALFAGEAEAQARDRTPLSCDGKRAAFHVKRAQRIIAGAHHAERILDPTPSKARERRAWRQHKLCVRDRERRRRIANRVDAAKREFAQTFEGYISPPGRSWLEATGNCESGSHGDYAADTGNGYAGRYQFDTAAWASTAGGFAELTGISPDPSRLAAPREQDIRAAILYRAAGSAPWPVCG